MQALEAAALGRGGDRQRERRRTTAATSSRRRRRRSYAYTASHTGALLRLAQIAEALGARPGRSRGGARRRGPRARRAGPVIEPPSRLVELIGAGPNAWTAQEGGLKIRESAYVATRGPLVRAVPATARASRWTSRTRSSSSTAAAPARSARQAIAGAMEVTGARVVRISEHDLGEALSIFPLTGIRCSASRSSSQRRAASAPTASASRRTRGAEEAIESLGSDCEGVRAAG